MHPIDLRKLRTAHHAIVATLRELKERQRESHQPRWNRGGSDDWALIRAKARATLLCSIRAEMRGRLHCKKTHEEQRSLIETGLNEFYKEVELAKAV